VALPVTIVQDLVCPWCFVGKRRLEQALAARPGLVAALSWRPFQLDPDMPRGGMDRRTHLLAKFGAGAPSERIHRALAEAGASVGIPFAFERIARSPNTLDAHRLVRFAQRHGRADALVENLFWAYFVEARDIGDDGVLVDIAAASGLERAEAQRYLASDAGLTQILADERDARRVGITAVPCFIFDRQYALTGAQEPEFFAPVFDLVLRGNERAAGGTE
jgi:predicted DsbA family dithiol-disulfide isomerase